MDFKRFGKNTIIYVIGNGCMRAVTFLLIPLYTHSLTLREYGLLSALFVTTQIMIILMSVGTQKGFIRFAKECEDRSLMGKLIGSTMAITVLGFFFIGGVSLLVLVFFFRHWLETKAVQDYILLTCFSAFTQAIYTHTTSYYRATEKGLYFIGVNLTALLLLIGTNLLLLRVFPHGVKGVLMAQVLTYGGVGLFFFLMVIKKTGLGFSLEWVKRLLWFSFPLLFAMSWDLVMESSALYLLGYFGTLEQVAIYSLGHKIAQIAYISLIFPFQLAYEPFVYGNLDHPKIRQSISKLLTYLMLTYALVSFILVFISRPLLSIIAPPDYFSAYTVVFLMLPGIGFIGVYYIGESLLSIKNRTTLIGGPVFLFTLFGLVLNYLLIPLWGIYGAILVFNVTIMLTAVSLMALSMKVFPIPLETVRLGVVGGLFLFSLAFVFILVDAPASIYYTVIPSVVGIVLTLLYWSPFFKEGERAMIKSVFKMDRLKGSPNWVFFNGGKG
jgi:O-antigen/teichoic acid export membrane protein